MRQRAITMMSHANLTLQAQRDFWAEAVACSAFTEDLVIKAGRTIPALHAWTGENGTKWENFDLKNSLKRPRRRFNQASKSDDSNEVLEEKIKVNHNASDIKAPEDENAFIKVVDLTTTTQLPLLENVIEEKKKPKIPVPAKKFELPKGLPKGFKLPKFNFGALQPKLLSFKIIRTTPSTTSTTTETSTTISSGSTEVTPPDTTSSSSKKLAFKDKLKFGRRKTFGSLLKSKRPKLLPSFLPTPAPTTTTLGTSTPIPTPEETQVDFRGINQANK